MTGSGILNFILWFAGTWLLLKVFQALAALIYKKLSTLGIRAFAIFFITVSVSVISLSYTVWIFTSLFFLKIYLLYFIMGLLAVILLIGMMYYNGLLSNTVMSRLGLKENWIISGHSTLSQTTYWILMGVGILSMVFTFYLAVIGDHTSDTLAVYLLLIGFVIAVLSNMGSLLSRIPLMLLASMDRTSRKDYFFTSFYNLYLVSVCVYFILAAMDVSVFDVLTVVMGFKVTFLFAVVIAIFFIFIAVLVIPYSIGENRRKQQELRFIEQKINYAAKIEKAVDLTDAGKTQNQLTALREEIAAQFSALQRKIENDQGLFNKLNYQLISSLKINQTEVDISFNELLEPQLHHLDTLRRYKEQIDYALQCNQAEVNAQLDKTTDDWKREAQNQAEIIKQKKSLAKRTMAIITAAWVGLNTLFGVTLTDFLKTLGLLE